MPYYDYLCQRCRRPARLFFSYAEYGRSTPTCPHCQSTQLKRRIGRIALAKSEDAHVASLSDDAMLAGLDENDPQAMGRMMKKMSREMGEDLGDDFNEVVDRLEKGESPEKIEKAMPELTGNDDA